jgi:hypothetical protein
MESSEVDTTFKPINDFLCSNGIIYCQGCKIESIDDLNDTIYDLEIILNRLRVERNKLR